MALVDHSIVSLDDRGDGHFFLTGGFTTGRNINNKAYLYKGGEWSRVADMPTARYALMCGSVLGADGMIEKIVAVGGQNKEISQNYLSIVEVYNIQTDEWTKGKQDLPEQETWAWGTVVPYNESFIIVGAAGSGKIYKYMTETDSWKEMTDMKFSKPINSVAAMLVSPPLLHKPDMPPP